MRAHRKSLSLVSGVVIAGLALMAWTQTWFVVTMTGQAATHPDIVAGGDIAAPAISALAIAALALIGAMAIAGKFFRIVLAVLQVAIGGCVVLSATLALGSPITAVAPLVTEATSVAGESSVAELIGSIAATPWPWIALVAGALMVALGLFVLATGRSWPGSSRKYQPMRFEHAQQGGAGRPDTAQSGEVAGDSSITDWDALSDGSDPTSG